MHNEDWLESDEDGSPMTWRPSRRCDDSNNNNSSNNKRSLNISSQGVSESELLAASSTASAVPSSTRGALGMALPTSFIFNLYDELSVS